MQKLRSFDKKETTPEIYINNNKTDFHSKWNIKIQKVGKMLILQKETSDLINCSYQQWYEKFKKNCIKSHCIQIPEDVKFYLKQDLFILPKECTPVSKSSETKFIGEASNFAEDEEEEIDTAPAFPEFSKQISDILRKLGKLL